MESTGELKIQEIGGKECVLVTLKKIATPTPVTVAFYDTVNKAMLSLSLIHIFREILATRLP